MKSLRQVAIQEAISRQGTPDSPISVHRIGQRVGLSPPFSLITLFEMALPEEVSFHGDVVTPAGTALGGWVDMTLRSNGTFSVHVHMHDSGLPDYDFQVRALFTTPSGLVLVAEHSGHVEGSGSWTPFHEPVRDADHREAGNNPMIRANWGDIKQGRLWVTKEYSPTGVAGFVQDVISAVLDVAAHAVGGALGVIITLGREAGQLFGDLGIGAAFGVIAGIVVFAVGGSVVLAVAAGVAAGAVTNSLIKQRPITQEEYGFAARVFGGSLPPKELIWITNLSGLGGRAFVMPGLDNKIYVNLGDAYDNPETYSSDIYPRKGQLLIHELTHVWQIHHRSFLAGTVCNGIVNQAHDATGASVYLYGAPGSPWSIFNLEAQAAVVDQWFGGNPTPIVPNRSREDSNDPYYPYIANNIRAGRT